MSRSIKNADSVPNQITHSSKSTKFKGKVFNFPSVSNSPTNSRETSRASSIEEISCDDRCQKITKLSYPHSPGAYRKTLHQLEEFKRRHPRLGSTSDYFSMASSMCSDDDCFDDNTSNSNSMYDKMISSTVDVDDEEDVLISTYLDIKAQTKAIEERNAELMKNVDDQCESNLKR